MSSDCLTMSDRMSPEVCIYSKCSRFSASHQDVSARTHSVLLLDAGQHAGICRRNWKCLMRECVQLVPGQYFIDYWNCLFLCPVTVATTCVTEWPHIPIYRKNDYYYYCLVPQQQMLIETQLLLFPPKVTLIHFFSLQNHTAIQIVTF